MIDPLFTTARWHRVVACTVFVLATVSPGVIFLSYFAPVFFHSADYVRLVLGVTAVSVPLLLFHAFMIGEQIQAVSESAINQDPDRILEYRLANRRVRRDSLGLAAALVFAEVYLSTGTCFLFNITSMKFGILLTVAVACALTFVLDRRWGKSLDDASKHWVLRQIQMDAARKKRVKITPPSPPTAPATDAPTHN